MNYVPDPPRDGELERLMSEVAYEHEMFNMASTRISEVDAKLEEALLASDRIRAGHLRLDQNGWIEVFLTHQRNLTEFYLSAPRGDDVVAHHYVKSWTEVDGGDSLQWLKADKGRINKRLHHLTAYRARVPAERPTVYEIDFHMRTVFQLWAELLTQEQKRWFRLRET